jgi:FKBP-type peptidyl-prolyl cis-trans isomerase
LSCENEENFQDNDLFGVFDKESSININKSWLEDEVFKIDQYCERQGWDMLSSESGLRYKILNKSNSGVKAKEGSEVVISYDIRLMDSFQTKCYSSDSSGLAKFIVQHSTIESGIHEVVTYLEKHDSALVILPHHIAHGISGDSKLIPPLSTVLYFIKIVDVE